nr:hypothetical protein [Tanacetum cinerariifolium]
SGDSTDKDYILLPLWTQDSLFSSSSKDSPSDGFKPLEEEEKKDDKDPGNEDNEVLSIEELRVNQEKDANVNSTNNINAVSPTANAASTKNNVVDKNIVYGCADDPNMLNLEEIVSLLVSTASISYHCLFSAASTKFMLPVEVSTADAS